MSVQSHRIRTLPIASPHLYTRSVSHVAPTVMADGQAVDVPGLALSRKPCGPSFILICA